MSDVNKAVIRRLYLEGFNAGNLGVLDEIYANDVELHIPGVPEDPFGAWSVVALFKGMRGAFPGLTAVIDDMICENDKVAARVAFHGPHQASPAGLEGFSPQRPLAAWVRIDIFRIFRGKIVEQWSDRDDSALMQQLGILPVQSKVPKVYADGSIRS